MSEETQETQETQATQETAPQPDDLAAIKAELTAERQAKATLETDLAAKDLALEALNLQLTTTQGDLATVNASLAETSQTRTAAVAKYLGAVRAANAAIPADVITGETIEAIDVSLGQAVAIADAVRATLAGEAKNARVPAGAPTRVISLEGLTSTEKIALGIQQQKGGSNQ